MTSETGPTWQVVTQVPTAQNVGGRAVQGVEITYQLGDGTTGEVFVARADYTPDKVRAVIDAHARNAWEIANLSSGG